MSYSTGGNKYTNTENKCAYLHQKTRLDELLKKTIESNGKA